MNDRRTISADGEDAGVGHLVARLQAMSPAAGVEVDFDAVAAEAGRRQARRTAARTGLGVGGIAAGLVLLTTTGILPWGMGGSPTSSAVAGRPERAATSPAVADASGAQSAAGAQPSASGAERSTAYPAELCPTAMATEGALPPDATGSWSPPFRAGLQLVPGERPISALVCRYRLQGAGGVGGPAVPSTYLLFEGGHIDTGLDILAQDLSTLRPASAPPRPCPLPADLLLLRLGYAGGGLVWVKTTATDQTCGGATNGSFRTDVAVGFAIEAAGLTSQWARLPPDRHGTPTLPPTP